MTKKQVTVYSCSGCSNVAQLANAVAVRLHRQGLARMSCIAGVGGDVPSLVKTAQNSSLILVLDGCPLECSAHCLKRHGVQADVHLTLTDLGLTKNPNEDVSPETVDEVFEKVKSIIEKMSNE